MVGLKIKNINTFRYQITVEGEQIEYTTPVPSELQTLFRLPDPTKKVSESEEAIAEAKGAVEQMSDAKNKVGNPVTGTSLFTLKSEFTTLVALCNTFIAHAQKIRDIKFRKAQLISLAKLKWRDHNRLTAAYNSLGPKYTVAAMQADFDDFFNAYSKVDVQYEITQLAAQSAAAPAVAGENRIKEAEEKIEEGYKKIKEDDYIKLIEDINILQITLEDPLNFELRSPPVQAEGDFLSFKINIVPDQTNALLPYESTHKAKLEIPIRKSWKADFSVGPAFCFLYGAKDEKYFLRPSPPSGNSETNKGTLEKGNNQSVGRPGVAAMLHAYPRTGKDYALGFMMGVGAGFKSEEAITATYFLGGSVILGKTQRIILSAGASFIPVDRLKSGYQAGNEYILESTKISDVTEKALRASAFFSISYNITNRIERK